MSLSYRLQHQTIEILPHSINHKQLWRIELWVHDDDDGPRPTTKRESVDVQIWWLKWWLPLPPSQRCEGICSSFPGMKFGMDCLGHRDLGCSAASRQSMVLIAEQTVWMLHNTSMHYRIFKPDCWVAGMTWRGFGFTILGCQVWHKEWLCQNMAARWTAWFWDWLPKKWLWQGEWLPGGLAYTCSKTNIKRLASPKRDSYYLLKPKHQKK